MTPAEALAALRRVRGRIAGGAVAAWDLETLDAVIACYTPACPRCEDTRWVCENHDTLPWYELAGSPPCCTGPGAPCPDCQPDLAALPAPGSVTS